MLHVSGTTWFQKHCATALLKSHLIWSVELSVAEAGCLKQAYFTFAAKTRFILSFLFQESHVLLSWF